MKEQRTISAKTKNTTVQIIITKVQIRRTGGRLSMDNDFDAWHIANRFVRTKSLVTQPNDPANGCATT